MIDPKAEGLTLTQIVEAREFFEKYQRPHLTHDEALCVLAGLVAVESALEQVARLAVPLPENHSREMVGGLRESGPA